MSDQEERGRERTCEALGHVWPRERPTVTWTVKQRGLDLVASTTCRRAEWGECERCGHDGVFYGPWQRPWAQVLVTMGIAHERWRGSGACVVLGGGVVLEDWTMPIDRIYQDDDGAWWVYTVLGTTLAVGDPRILRVVHDGKSVTEDAVFKLKAAPVS